MNGFRQLVGQQYAIALLQQAIERSRLAPAYLFAGPSGIGRSLAAKCFTNALLSQHLGPEKQVLLTQRIADGNHPDLLWVQPTYQHQGQLLSAEEAQKLGIKRKTLPQIRIEQVREISQFLSRPPLEASRCIVTVSEAQSMTEAAANALLKTLEEPGRATLILIAPSPDALLPTLVSRCQTIPFYRLSDENLRTILIAQGHEVILQHSEVLAIAQGSPGEAIAAYEQLQIIPTSLREQLQKVPSTALEALELAKIVAQELDTQAQLWLLSYLQYFYWQKLRNKKLLEKLEKARQYLTQFVQPRLVWECLLLEMSQISLISSIR